MNANYCHLVLPFDAERTADHAWWRRPAGRPQIETRRAWRDRVRRALHAIAAGRLDKVVLARAVRITPAAGRIFDVRDIVNLLADQDEAAYPYAVPMRHGTLVGLTPEVLAEPTADGRLRTWALAGTAPRGDTPAEDLRQAQRLRNDPKQRAEHAWVVAALRERMQVLCTDVVAPDAPQVLRLRHVMHLATPLHGRMRTTADDAAEAHAGTAPRAVGPAGWNWRSIAQALHPTPAVAGWPVGAALQWLRRHEPLDRGPYAGVVLHAGQRLVVALRCAWVRPTEAFAFAGAGIVAGSDPDAEWEETEWKLQTIRAALVARPLRTWVAMP